MDDDEESDFAKSADFDSVNGIDDFDDSDEIEEFEAAVRVGNKWLKKLINSEETFNEFMRGIVSREFSIDSLILWRFI